MNLKMNSDEARFLPKISENISFLAELLSLVDWQCKFVNFEKMKNTLQRENSQKKIKALIIFLVKKNNFEGKNSLNG